MLVVLKQIGVRFFSQQCACVFVRLPDRNMQRKHFGCVRQNMHHLFDKICTTFFLHITGEREVVHGHQDVEQK